MVSQDTSSRLDQALTAGINQNKAITRDLQKTACSVSPEPQMLGDITMVSARAPTQLLATQADPPRCRAQNAEVIVNGIQKLSAASGNPVTIVSWSQG